MSPHPPIFYFVFYLYFILILFLKGVSKGQQLKTSMRFLKRSIFNVAFIFKYFFKTKGLLF